MSNSIKNIRHEGKIWIKAMIAYVALVCFFCIFVYTAKGVICSGRAQGVITDITRQQREDKEGAYRYMLNISFTTGEGETYQVDRITDTSSTYQVNQTVDVHYDPKRPETFYVAD